MNCLKEDNPSNCLGGGGGGLLYFYRGFRGSCKFNYDTNEIFPPFPPQVINNEGSLFIAFVSVDSLRGHLYCDDTFPGRNSVH